MPVFVPETKVPQICPLDTQGEGPLQAATAPYPLALEVFLLAWRWLVPGAGSLSSVKCCSGSWDVAAAAAAVVTLMVFFKFATYQDGKARTKDKFQ